MSSTSKEIQFTFGPFQKIQNSLRNTLSANIWRCEEIDPATPALKVSRRSTNRPICEGGRGPGGGFLHQSGGWGMSTPDNVILFKKGTDTTFLSAMRERGLLYETDFAGSLDEIYKVAERHDRPMYMTDGYGSRFDKWARVPFQTFLDVNRKSCLGRYVSPQFFPIEEKFDLRNETVDEAMLARLTDNGKHDLYLKPDNGEQGGNGVLRIRSQGSLRAMLEKVKAQRYKLYENYREVNREVEASVAAGVEPMWLSPYVILQRGMTGRNRSFSVWLDPETPEEVLVVAVTEKLYDAATGASKGNLILSPRPEMHRLQAAIADLVQGVRKHHPEAFGILKCDFFQDDQTGQISLYDIGLRPSATTPGSFIRIQFEDRGWTTPPVIQSDYVVNLPDFSVNFEEAARRMGPLFDVDRLWETGRGVLPVGWHGGKGRFIVCGTTREEELRVEAELLQRLSAN